MTDRAVCVSARDMLDTGEDCRGNGMVAKGWKEACVQRVQ